MIDMWQEIWSAMRTSKLRTFMTGFSVAWGIFMLIILLGAGNGLKNGTLQNFGSRAQNSMTLWRGWTSIPYAGMQQGRRIKFQDSDMTALEAGFSNVHHLSPTIERYLTLTVGKEYSKHNLLGVVPEVVDIRNLEIVKGRFINQQDMLACRKVIVIHEKTVPILFRDSDPINQYINVNGILYQVIGIYTDDTNWHSPNVFVPLSTANTIYGRGASYDYIEFIVDGLGSQEDGRAFTTDVRHQIARVQQFDPNDMSAIYIWNRMENYLEVMGIFNGITLFVWIIGIGTLIAGIVGVGNIMLITVKERTREFGIRKALGATPFSILRLVVVEAIIITSLFGYIGMIMGVLLTELINNILEQGSSSDMSVFSNPTVDLSVVFTATAVLIVSGIVAGLIPAIKAVRIKPIEALRSE